MTERAAELVWLAVAAYTLAGLAIAIGVVALGSARLTPTAADMPLRVRVLMLPGLTVLWPLILALLIRGPTE